MTYPRTLVTLTVLGLALALGSGYVAMRESQVYLAGGTSSVLRLAAITAQGSAIPLSYEGQRGTLADCELVTRSMNTMQMRKLPDDSPPQILANCLAIADAITAWAPTDSYAFIVAAQAIAQQGDVAAAIPRYIAAAETGPNEQWLGEMRVTFAEKYLDQLTPEALRLHEADLLMLAQSHKGIVYLAKRYVSYPEFRPRISAVFENVSGSFQSSFIFNVRQQIDRVRPL